MLKKSILEKLSQGKTYDEISIELQSVEQGKTITDKLLAGPMSILWTHYFKNPVKSRVVGT